MKNLSGQKFGKLLLLEKDSNNKAKYICKCDCGTIKSVSRSHIVAGNTTSCGCIKRDGSLKTQWKGCGEISGNFWHMHIIRSASGSKQGDRIRRPKDLNITIEYIWDLFLKQDRKCALSGIILVFPKHGKDRLYTASLDRIDSFKGYIVDNVQWVHKDINIMKNKFSQEYFIEICKLISQNYA